VPQNPIGRRHRTVIVRANMSSIGKSVPHDSAEGHVSGRSVFLADVPTSRNELLLGFLGSPVAYGKICSLDLSAAAGVTGVVALLTYKDIPGHNQFGPLMHDEHLLAVDTVRCVGDPIVLIAAENEVALAAAKRAIRLELEELTPILTLDEAIAAESFIGPQRVVERGDVKEALAAAPYTLQGTLTTGGQEHFYFESHIAIAQPGEDNQVTVLASTQHPTEVQQVVAEILGVPFNHVVVVCKRLGGGFGGKETQAAAPAALAALAAAHTRRPCRFIFSRDDDMSFTGKRHPFQSQWRAGFDTRGRILALSLDLFSDAGCTCDLSPSIMERAMLHADNAYFIPNFRVTGRVCKTNLPSNTAFRGFGVPQAVATIENIVEEIAQFLKMDALDVRQVNCYGIQDRNVTPYGQIVRNTPLPLLFSQLRTASNYDRRREEIAVFNAASPAQMRGLSLTAVKFGISFTSKTLNQANALVNIYTDGSVLVSTGGTEMGQGLCTRLRQIVANELGIGYDAVRVAPTSTDKNNNTSPTAASTGTDLNGAAAAEACRKLRLRLAELAATLLADKEAGLLPSPMHVRFEQSMVFDLRRPQKQITFQELVVRAYQERVNLGERGFYAIPGIDFNRETGKGTPFFYFTCGVAAAEVLIDRLTGELRVCRVDVLIDAGRRINPAIDYGQVTGGFVQGMGWVTNEELKYSGRGELLSHSPTTYKIPNIADLPEVFNINFFDGSDCAEGNFYHSKAVGEPPLPLAISVWTAVKNALSYASPEAAATLTLPATAETILLAIERQRRRAAACGVAQA
jgi:xanthine dehydrogenase large subunit